MCALLHAWFYRPNCAAFTSYTLNQCYERDVECRASCRLPTVANVSCASEVRKSGREKYESWKGEGRILKNFPLHCTFHG